MTDRRPSIPTRAPAPSYHLIASELLGRPDLHQFYRERDVAFQAASDAAEHARVSA